MYGHLATLLTDRIISKPVHSLPKGFCAASDKITKRLEGYETKTILRTSRLCRLCPCLLPKTAKLVIEHRVRRKPADRKVQRRGSHVLDVHGGQADDGLASNLRRLHEKTVAAWPADETGLDDAAFHLAVGAFGEVQDVGLARPLILC